MIVDRSLGATLTKDSEIEIMIQRRTFKDDSRGVDEALNEVDDKGNGLAVTLHMKLVIESKIRRFEEIPWVRAA